MSQKIFKEIDEEVIEEVRRHPIVLAVPFFKVFIGLVIVGFILIIFKASVVFSVAFFLWFILGGIYSFYFYYIWRKDSYILTDSRVIVREQKSFFSKQASEASLGDITDVTYKIKGFWATLFNFGTVQVQTASSDALKLVKVPKPHRLQELILDLRDRFRENNKKELSARELINEIEKKKEN